jgi:hypothetical protein
MTESKYSDCWEENKPDIKIGVERCGCNSSTKAMYLNIQLLLLGMLSIFLLIYFASF